ncbi:unnamed protein product [Effrenium voratum]|nr:unnamed protein product [Effrenium voratum]
MHSSPAPKLQEPKGQERQPYVPMPKYRTWTAPSSILVACPLCAQHACGRGCRAWRKDTPRRNTPERE